MKNNTLPTIVLALAAALQPCMAQERNAPDASAQAPVQILSQEEGYVWVSVDFGTDNATLAAQLEQAGFPPAVSRLVRESGLQNTFPHGEMREKSPIQLAIYQSPGLTRIDYSWRGICWECYIGSDAGAPLLRVCCGPGMTISGLERKGDYLLISYYTHSDPLQQKGGWALPLFREGLEPRLRSYYVPYWSERVPLFPSSGADVVCDTEQDTAFVAAAMEADIPAMEKALAAGADPNARCCGHTALQLVCHRPARNAAEVSKKEAAVRFLLQHGADVHVGADLEESPLRLALWQYREDTAGVAKLLLESGADANAKGGWGAPILFTALDKDNVLIVELLLQHGANPNAARNGGVTLLMEAAEDGQTDIIRLLLDAGADAQAVDVDGRSALDHANSEDTARFIREYTPAPK